MAPGSLTSDHVNYLVWRYLQESGRGEAAVKFQKDWLVDPQTLPFAHRIKSHALVSLLQKGLQYHQIEQSLDQPEIRTASSAATLFFGADPRQSSSTPDQERPDNAASNSPKLRKHGRESTTNGLSLEAPTPAPAPKRNRRSNGMEVSTNGERIGGDGVRTDQNGYHYQQNQPPDPASPTGDSAVDDDQGNGMDIDGDADVAASPDPNDQLTLTLTNGQSIGVQSDKIAELGPQTNVLTVPDTTHVMHSAWNPKDPTVLAVAGQALCRLWFISKTATSGENPNHKSYVDILDASYGSLVTTMAWSSNGEILAIATRDDSADCAGAVCLWSKMGKALDELPATQDMIIKLRWSPSGNELLGITSSGSGASSLNLWDIPQMMPPYVLPYIITDAAWTSNNQLTICGHGFIASSLLESQRILTHHPRNESSINQLWSHIRYDSRTHTTALAAEETGILGLIDSSDTLRIIKAHEADITGLEFQPITNLSAYPADAPRLLASSSIDGTIKVWDAKRPFSVVHTLLIGNSSPALSISFTPDGFLIAAATWSRVLIWNAEAGGLPKATWKGTGVLEKLPNGVATDGDIDRMDTDENGDEQSYSMSWDADGGALVLGVGNQIAIINFRP